MLFTPLPCVAFSSSTFSFSPSFTSMKLPLITIVLAFPKVPPVYFPPTSLSLLFVAEVSNAASPLVIPSFSSLSLLPTLKYRSFPASSRRCSASGALLSIVTVTLSSFVFPALSVALTFTVSSSPSFPLSAIPAKRHDSFDAPLASPGAGSTLSTLISTLASPFVSPAVPLTVKYFPSGFM